MRKQLLLAALSAFILTAVAGEKNPGHISRKAVTNAIIKKPAVMPVTVKENTSQRGARALNKIVLSSAGNLLSVSGSNSNQLYIDDSINSVVFIHRNDQSVNGGNVAQYRFDVSKDGGANWTPNIGPLNPTADNVNINGRFPQAVIYRAPGVTVADSAYLVYSGTWHDGANGSWEGEYRGAAKLSGNPATFKESNDIVNGGVVAVAGGFTQGAPGTFINVNTSSDGTFNGTTSHTNGVLIEKGVWNNTTKKADWTLDVKNLTLEDVVGSANTFSAIVSPVAGFDPTGQYGWVAVYADTSIDATYTFRPILYKSVDYGTTWTGPIEINLDNLPGMFTSPEIIDQQTGAPYVTAKTIVGGLDLVVDNQGNVHIAAVVGIGLASESSYSYFPNAGMALYDIAYTPGNQCGDWNGNFIAQVFSVNGSYTSDGFIDDNRVQAARSADGKNIFIFWNDTDESIASQQTGDNNVSPNLFGVGLDLAAKKMTAAKNFTLGDPEFGGETPTSPSGTLYGALFPVVSQNAFTKTSSHNVPVVLTEPDYNAQPASKSSENPARFYYCKNIDFLSTDYTLNLDRNPPVITINGADTVIIVKDSTYTDLGATAFDCEDGVVTVFTSSNVVTNTPGYYEVTYYATDAAGNSDTVYRTVLVAAKPVALFNYTKVSGNKYNFRDSSLYFPTSRTWAFGDGSGSSLTNVSKTYAAAGTVNVCLTVSNAYGSDNTCKTLEIFLGIEDVALSEAVSVYPTNGKGNLTVSLNDQFRGDVSVTVFDLQGQKAAQDVTIIKFGITSSTIDYTSLASGVYNLRIGNKETGYAVKSFIINK